MAKDRHLKLKLSARVSKEALQNLENYTKGCGFESVSEALDFLLLDFLNQFSESEAEMQGEKKVVDEFKAFQRKSNIPNLPDALKEYYKSKK
jgi:hypothetical protein